MSSTRYCLLAYCRANWTTVHILICNLNKKYIMTKSTKKLLNITIKLVQYEKYKQLKTIIKKKKKNEKLNIELPHVT